MQASYPCGRWSAENGPGGAHPRPRRRRLCCGIATSTAVRSGKAIPGNNNSGHRPTDPPHRPRQVARRCHLDVPSFHAVGPVPSVARPLAREHRRRMEFRRFGQTGPPRLPPWVRVIADCCHHYAASTKPPRFAALHRALRGRGDCFDTAPAYWMAILTAPRPRPGTHRSEIILVSSPASRAERQPVCPVRDISPAAITAEVSS